MLITNIDHCNESESFGIAANADGTFTALTLVKSKTFKTRGGAERWLRRNASASQLAKLGL